MTSSELPALQGLSPAFVVTVLETDDPAAFLVLQRFLRDTLAEPGRAHAVRVLGELLLTDPADRIDGLGPLSELGFDGLYLAVRQRWQSPRWTDEDGITDLANELTLVLRRHRLVAVHTSISSAVLRSWTRTGAPYRFLPDTVLDAYDRETGGVVDVAPAMSRLTTGVRLDFASYLTQLTDVLDVLDKALVAEDTPQ